MTRAELVTLVDQAYATYNQNLPTDGDRLKAVYMAWFSLLHDLDIKEARAAFTHLAVVERFMPRPGDVRRTAINRRNNFTQFEDAVSAWGKFVGIVRDTNSGVPITVGVSEALRGTMKALGEAAYHMHTNSDRDAFSKTYDRVVSEIDERRYAVPEVEEDG
jgi:hypothetical protein